MAGLKYEKMAKTGIHVSVQQNRWIKKSFGRNSHGEGEGRTTGNLFHRGGGTGEGGIYVMVDPMALKGSVKLVSSNTE